MPDDRRQRPALALRLLASLAVGAIAPAALAQSPAPSGTLASGALAQATPRQPLPAQAPVQAPPVQAAPRAAPAIAPAAASPDARTRGAPASPVEMVVGPMGGNGTLAGVMVYVTNVSAAAVPASILACTFVAQGQVLATARAQVAALRPGERAAVTAVADVGGQLVDRVACSGE